jgi:hypothetical protein
MTIQKRKSRLAKVLVLAAALGCSSASLSGVLVVFAMQQSPGAQAIVA